MSPNGRRQRDKKQSKPVSAPKEGEEDALVDEQAQKNITRQGQAVIESEEERFYANGLRILNETGVPYYIGAAFARHAYTGIWRKTKDLDIFIRPQDLKTVLKTFEEAGYTTTVDAPHWLAKIHDEDYFIDIIFGTGHGQLAIDDSWFESRQPANILDVQTWLMPFEELLTSSLFIGVRDRFDAADIVHLIRARQGKIDWERVLSLLGEHWELLLWHLIIFDYVYPGHANYLPQDLMVRLFKRVRDRWKETAEDPKAFRGTIIDPFSFTVDVEDWGYEDRRNLTPIVDEEGEVI